MFKIRKYLNPNEMKYLNVEYCHNSGYTGKGIKVAIIDTSLNVTAFNQKIADVIRDPFNISISSLDTHGQHVADLINQVAPDAEIYILPTSQTISPNLQEALPWCIENGINIISMSMAGWAKDEVRNLEKQCYDSGIVLVTSAGNTGKEVTDAAKYPFWVSVGAVHLVDGKIEMTDYSSTGEELDIISFSRVLVSGLKNNNRLRATGTSYSCPIASGMIALYLEVYKEMFNKFPTARWVKKILQSHTEDLYEDGFDIKTGYGLFILPKIGQITEEYIMTFEDVNENMWSYNAIEEVSSRKLMNGKSNQVFDPKAFVTREEMAQTLFNLIQQGLIK